MDEGPISDRLFADSRRNSPSLLARQIRLRLVAEEGSDTPKGCNNIVVSIHAIATFQALNDYLRPRLSGLLSSISGSRFSGMLAALTGGRFPAALLGGAPDGSAPAPANPPAPEPAAANNTSAAAEGSKAERRRSLRLSAKASVNSLADKADAQAAAGSAGMAPPSVASTSTAVTASQALQKEKETGREENVADGGRSETAVNDEDDDLPGDFMDADVDAEVSLLLASMLEKLSDVFLMLGA